MNQDAMGSEQDPQQWLREYGDQLYRYALFRVSKSDVAEDLVQETLLGGISSRAGFDGRSTIKTWLFAILRNKIRDHFALQSRREVHTSSQEAIDEQLEMGELLRPELTNREFASCVERDEFRSTLSKCVDDLPPHLAEAFLIRSAEDERTVREISRDLDLSESNFNVRLFRARLMLRKCLERTWLGDK